MITKQEKQMFERAKKVLSVPQLISHTYKNHSRILDKEIGIDIFFAPNSPQKGLLTCTTLGLINYDIGFMNGEKDIRIELVGSAIVKNEEDSDIIARILSTAAFGIMERNLKCGLGTVFPNILTGYLKNADMKHLLFISPPAFWKEPFGAIDLEDFTLTWLYAVPISDAELEYLRIKGGDKDAVSAVRELLKLLGENKVNLFDLDRKSVEIPDEEVSESEAKEIAENVLNEVMSDMADID